MLSPKPSWSELPLLQALFMLESGSADGQSLGTASNNCGSHRFNSLEPEADTVTAKSVVEQLIRAHHLLAISRAPLEMRVKVLRVLVEHHPEHKGWLADLQKYELAWQEELKKELKSLACMEDRVDVGRSEMIVRLLAEAHWQAPLNSQEVRSVQGLRRRIHEAVSRVQFPSQTVGRKRENTVKTPRCREHSESGWHVIVLIGIFLGLTVIALLIRAGHSAKTVSGHRIRGEVEEEAGTSGLQMGGSITHLPVSLAESMTTAVDTFGKLARDPSKSGGEVQAARLTAESIIAEVGRELEIRKKELPTEQLGHVKGTPDEAKSMRDKLCAQLEQARKMMKFFNNERGKADDSTLSSHLDALASGSWREDSDFAEQAERLLVDAEIANGVQREGLRARLRAFEERQLLDRDRWNIGQALDRSLKGGLDAYLLALESIEENHPASSAEMRADVVNVLATREHYRAAAAWGQLAKTWSNPMRCSRQEATAWRESLRRAMAVPIRAVGEGRLRQLLGDLDQHLEVVERDPARVLSSIDSYLCSTIMKAGVVQVAYEGRTFYVPSSEGMHFFIDEETTRPSVDVAPLHRPIGTAAVHLKLVDKMKLTIQRCLEEATAVDEAIASLLIQLGDDELVGDVDPILLCRLQKDVLDLAATRPLFKEGSAEIEAALMRLQGRLGDRPRWVWSANWTSGQAWEAARIVARSVIVSEKTLRKVADSAAKKAAMLREPPLFARNLEFFGWIDSEGVSPEVRCLSRSQLDREGNLLVVRPSEFDGWQLLEIGRSESGESGLLPSVDVFFGEPIFFEPTSAHH